MTLLYTNDVVSELYTSGHSELLRRQLNELPHLKKMLGADDSGREERFKVILGIAVDNLQKLHANLARGYSPDDVDVALNIEMQRMDHRLAAGRTAEVNQADIVLTGMLHPRQAEALKGMIEDLPGIRRLLGNNPEKKPKLDYVLGTMVDLMLQSGEPGTSFASLEQMDRNEIAMVIRGAINKSPVFAKELIQTFEREHGGPVRG